MDIEDDVVLYGGVVPVTPKAVRRFREPVIFLVALNLNHKRNLKRNNDAPRSLESETDEVFHNFVCKLGQICDWRPGGDTVTSFAVQQHPDKVEYVFGCNYRRPIPLRTVHGFITSILETLRDVREIENEEQQDVFESSLLRDILEHSRSRVKCYLNGLAASTEACIDLCKAENTKQAHEHRERFCHIRDAVALASQADSDEDDIFEHIESLLEQLQRLQSTRRFALFVRQRAADDRARNTEPWREFNHHCGRLISYKRAIQVFMDAALIWPELFDKFEVTAVPSSARDRILMDGNPPSAVDIINRMKLPPEDAASCIKVAENLQQMLGLDSVIKEQWNNRNARLTVHAEVLVHNYLERIGGTRPERFFNNWRFVGSSKPTCRLCHYYFLSHGGGVEVRGTSGNLYANWRMPDYADVHGCRTEAGAAQKRLELMQAISTRIKQEVARTLKEGVTNTRTHDSSTSMTSRSLQVARLGGSLVTQTAPGGQRTLGRQARGPVDVNSEDSELEVVESGDGVEAGGETDDEREAESRVEG
ncbi:hypothetical protein QBC46DRAFT_359230 [Diplogelasinospora grovesii]|uniref:Uncharacterized protein n=1 Tax=Diplogelasinospora grovesii TaxID=303347 RepID=A0AAN6RY36_9PEZI|nr:hypothetical protein QBC46DRAFT_359230 [Diplogelasinospora grovesii]